MTNLDPYLAVYFITFVVLILLEVPIAYAMLASAFEFIVFNHQSFVMFGQRKCLTNYVIFGIDGI